MTPSETLPAITPENRGFWEAADRGILALPTCRHCGHVWYPPSSHCPSCLSRNIEFGETSGCGTVWSWIVMHRQYFPEFPAPYVVIFVKLDAGPMLMSTIAADMDSSALRCDLPVRAVFEKNAQGVPLLRFRPP